MHSPGEQIAQSRTDKGPPGPKGTQGRGEKRTRVAGPGGEDGAGQGRAGQRARGAGRAGWEHPAACRAPRVPADLQRAQDRAPAAGHRRLRPRQRSRTRRRGRFLSGPGAEGPEPGRGVGSRAGQCGAHLSSRAASARACAVEEFCVRLEGVLPQVSTIPPGAHSHRHRSHRNHRKPGSRFVTGARLPAQRRRRACAVASVLRERGQRTTPAFNRSRPAAPPLGLSPPPRATSRPLRS